MDLQIPCNNFDQWLGAIIWSFVGMFFQESPAKKAGGTRTLVPFHNHQQVFVLISRIGFRNINFSFFLNVFMCSWHFLVFSKHCQHKCEYTIKKSPKKWGGPATRTLMPFQVDNWFFIVISRMDIRNINLSFFSSVFMCPWHFLVISEYCQQKLRIHNQENTKKLWGPQSFGVRAPELWCPFKLTTGFLF